MMVDTGEKPVGEADAVRIDEVGYWSEIKLDIVRKYASAYSIVMAKQEIIRKHIYIDGFAGAGTHISKISGRFIPGSPLNALNVVPPFKEFHFVDLDGGRARRLRDLAKGRSDVLVYEGDCNDVLTTQVFPRARYEDYNRALCLLDPYGLHLNWEVMRMAGETKSIEIFLNFPVMDMHMNVLWRDSARVKPEQAARMDSFWGDRTWLDVAYTKNRGLFGDIEEKATIEKVAAAFRERLHKVAGFKFVPDPMPMRNTRGGIVYYLFFASPNEKGDKIVRDIFQSYRNRGVV